ncbi:MAG: helix-hairpin-helix domain-containing protein [Pirellulales bacterium]|nr:helix-hairpin-helix domain-containing protein [Pirellulales bacterium]
MVDPAAINLQYVARDLKLPLHKVQAAVELLDEGNTVPFITRYRKDRTGGLDEEQIRRIQDQLRSMRLLAERKQTILRSIESQGKLTERLAKQIQSATTTKRLEDLYLPFKPKKQTLATLARSRGLEPLAHEILAAAPMCADLDQRAADFVNPDKGVATAADALLGAGHILAEQFSERADLRQRLREVMHRTGVLVSCQIVPPSKKTDSPAGGDSAVVKPDETSLGADAAEQNAPSAADPESTTDAVEASPVEPADSQPAEAAPLAEDVAPTVDAPPAEAAGDHATEAAPAELPDKPIEDAAGQPPAEPTAKPVRPPKPTPAQSKKKQAQEKKLKAFSDYFDYRESAKKVPPHRVLAINRGERARILRVRVESDVKAAERTTDEVLIPVDHPHVEFLRGCAHDALVRLILPSLERELRREMTEKAETHAVEVFARNLRNLLLQPPIRDSRILAVDPGYRSGCKLVALDQFGNVLGHDVVYLVGKSQHKDKAKEIVIGLIDQFGLSVVVIGNGTACRETEHFFAELIAEECKDRDLAYVIVNEAGASVYSTSPLARDEFPEYDATVRGSISIGRRLQDPLSELVKIDPARIGVGLYQHDVKAKHLHSSLDDVVESCVNFVGVNLNMASAALLRRVSGLNQLTARRLCQHRLEHGPFRSREQLKEVPGIGESTFVQAAGFLKIAGGDQPLDGTWIHPESYEVATRILAQLGYQVEDLADRAKLASLAEKAAAIDVAALGEQLQVGTLLLKDILAQLRRPGRDPREDLPKPVFKRGVIKLEDLAPGMALHGTVLNVVDFGAFVDIGMHDSGLVHISQLANQFVRDPHDVVAVGDIVRVWVVGVDKERRRVSLTMIPPGTKPPERPARQSRPPRGKSAASASSDQGSGQQERPPSRPPRPRRTEGQKEGGRDKSGGRSREGGRGRGGGHGKGGRFQKTNYQPKSRPKPVVPITKRMVAGVEPMRTFGDLAQFYEIQQSHKDETEAPPEPQKEPVEAKNPPTVEINDSPSEETRPEILSTPEIQAPPKDDPPCGTKVPREIGRPFETEHPREAEGPLDAAGPSGDEPPQAE